MAKMELNTNYEMVEDRGDFTPFQPGEYAMAFTKTDYVDNSAKNGNIFKYTAQVCDGGEFNGRLVFGNLNINHPNQQTKKIAEEEFKEILIATGVAYYDNAGSFINNYNGDTESLENIPFFAAVNIKPESKEEKNGVETGKTFPAKNVIKKYKPLNAVDGQQPTAPAKPTPGTVTPTPQTTVAAGTTAVQAGKPALPGFLAGKAK